MATGPEGGTYLAIRRPDGTELLAREVGTRRRTWHERLDPATGAWVEDPSLAAWFAGERPGGRRLSSAQALGLGSAVDVRRSRLARPTGTWRPWLALALLGAVIGLSFAGRAEAAPGEAASIGGALWHAVPAASVALLLLLGSWLPVPVALAGLGAWFAFDLSAHADTTDDGALGAVSFFLAPLVLALLVLLVGVAEAVVRLVVLGAWRRAGLLPSQSARSRR